MPKRLLIASALSTAAAGGGISLAKGDVPPPQPLDREIFLVPVDEITVPIVDAGHLDGSLRLKIAVEATDAASRDRIGAQMPELRAASVAALTDFGRVYASSMTAVDAERLRARLGDALKRSQAGIKDVLIVQVSAEAA